MQGYYRWRLCKSTEGFPYFSMDNAQSLLEITKGVVGEGQSLQIRQLREVSHIREVVVVEDQCLQIRKPLQVSHRTTANQQS